MDRTWVRILILGAIALAVIAVLALLIIFIFNQIFRTAQPQPTITTPTPTPLLTPTPTITPTPSPTPTITPTPTIPIVITTPTPFPPVGGAPPQIPLNIHQGPGFTLFFPQNWGITTCVNSDNFELDPESNINQTIFCTVALKPVTVLVENDLNNCPGEIVALGNILVIKSVTITTFSINYKWCTISQPVLKFTHRVSSTLNRAFSQQDFSQQVEFVISSLRFT